MKLCSNNYSAHNCSILGSLLRQPYLAGITGCICINYSEDLFQEDYVSFPENYSLLEVTVVILQCFEVYGREEE